MPSAAFLASLGVRVADPVSPVPQRTEGDAPDVGAGETVPAEAGGDGADVQGTPGPAGDVATFLAAQCVRVPRVWTEPARLYYAYRRGGGRLDDRDAFLAALGARQGPSGLVLGIGLSADWGPEDGGTAPRRAHQGGGG